MRVMLNSYGDETSLRELVERRRAKALKKAESLNYWSVHVGGFLPMDEAYIKDLMELFYESQFRSRAYYRIDKYAKQDELVSVRDLVIEVLKSLE